MLFRRYAVPNLVTFSSVASLRSTGNSIFDRVDPRNLHHRRYHGARTFSATANPLSVATRKQQEAAATAIEEGEEEAEAALPDHLFVAPHGSCLLFDTEKALFEFETRPAPPVTHLGSNCLPSDNSTNDDAEDGLQQNTQSLSLNPTAVFFLNQPATDEGACGLNDTWSEKEKSDLQDFVKRASSKRAWPSSGQHTSATCSRPSSRFDPHSISKVVDVGCGTGRFTVMWPSMFPNLKTIVLVEPCRHFLEAAVDKLKAQYAWVENEGEASDGDKALSFGYPKPLYTFYLTPFDEFCEDAGANIKANPKTIDDTATTNVRGRKTSVRVECYQLTTDEFAAAVNGRRDQSLVSQSEETKGRGKNENSNRQKQQEDRKGSKEGEEGILITTGVVQYLSDAQIRTLAQLERWTMMKEDVSMATIKRRELLEWIERTRQGRGTFSVATDRDNECDTKRVKSSLDAMTKHEAVAPKNSTNNARTSNKYQQFENGKHFYRVPMLSDLIRTRLEEAKEKRPQTNTEEGAERVVGDEFSPRCESDANSYGDSSKSDSDKAVIPISLCYASDGGTVRSLAHFEYLLGKVGEQRSYVAFGEKRRDVGVGVDTHQEQEDGVSNASQRPFFTYYSSIQWDMPQTFYCPLCTWLLRRRE